MRVLDQGHAPERDLWGSNWPHALAEKIGYPDDAHNLDASAFDWAPDAAQKLIPADNAAESASPADEPSV